MRNRAVNALFGQIERAGSAGALWGLMVRYFRDSGFDAGAYILFDRVHLGDAVAILDYGFPPEIMATYAALGYGRYDAVLRVAMATGRPISRSALGKPFKLSRQETWHRNSMQRLGVEELIGLPLFGPHGRDALAVLAHPHSPRAIEQAHLTELHMAAQAAHLRGFTLQPTVPPEPDGLSLREIEILRLIAQGKSNGVIAEILGISAGTVDTYVRRIFEKMQVTDRTSAAVKGVSMGLIRT